MAAGRVVGTPRRSLTPSMEALQCPRLRTPIRARHKTAARPLRAAPDPNMCPKRRSRSAHPAPLPQASRGLHQAAALPPLCDGLVLLRVAQYLAHRTSPVNASPQTSPSDAHDSGPMWFALPSSSGTRTLSFLPVSRRTCVKTRLLPATLAYSLADTLPRGESGFSTSMEVLSAGLAAALREAVHGRADPEQARIAALLAGRMG